MPVTFVEKTGTDNQAWEGWVPWYTSGPYYQAERAPGGQFRYWRPFHPLLGELNGTAATGLEAQNILQADYDKHLQLNKWVQYQLTHNPPA